MKFLLSILLLIKKWIINSSINKIIKKCQQNKELSR